MIEIDFDHMNWSDMDDEEQIKLCEMVIREYEDAVKPWVSKLLYYGYSDPVVKVASQNIHDWNRMRTNLRFAAQPNKLGENKSALRWQIMYKLHQINAFLEYAWSLGQKGV